MTGSGGDIHLSVGTGSYGDGGNVKMIAGSTTAEPNIKTPFKSVNATGGSVEIRSGASQETSSGEISVSTADAGVAGVSGQLRLKTGNATEGMAGYIGEFF